MPGRLKPPLPHAAGEAPPAPRAGIPRLFWLVTILVGVAAGGGIALLHSARQPAQAALGPAPAATPDLSWAPGRRRAPDFALLDQGGRPISLARFRGRPVIVTFIDPLCRNLCPVEAGILNHVAQALPGPERPAIVAVSVDPWGDAHANLVEDDQKWHLTGAWRWAVGSQAQLDAVWRDYAIGVSVATKRFAGVTLRTITHTEAAYLIDPHGYERALYVFPFDAAAVTRTTRTLESAVSG